MEESTLKELENYDYLVSRPCSDCTETKYGVSETGSSHVGLRESVILSHWKGAYAEAFN
jgi:hypothetical protein